MNYKSILTVAISGILLTTGTDTSLLAQKHRPAHHQPVVRKSKAKSSNTNTRGQYPEGTDRLLTEQDIEHQTPWGMKVMMNEIYARHGFIFTDPILKKHFRKEKWYKGKERRIRNIRLTDTEQQNISFIRRHQPKARD